MISCQNNAKNNFFSDGVYFCTDNKKIIVYISPKVAASHGILQKNICGLKSLQSFLFADLNEYTNFLKAIETGEEHKPFIIKSKDNKGYLLFLKLQARIITEIENEGYAVEGFFTDVTKEMVSGVSAEEASGEDKLSENIGHTELVKLLINSGNDVIFAKDYEGRYIFVNQTFSELAGMSPDKIAGKLNKDIVNFNNRIAIEEFTMLRYPHRLRSYTAITLKNDTVEYFLPDVKQLRLSNYDSPVMLVTARNVTPIAKAEIALSRINDTLSEMVSKRTEQLELSNRNFSVLFEKGNEIKFLTRPTGEILKTNEKARKLFGLSESKMKNLNITRILDKDYYLLRPKITEEMENKGSASFEGNLTTADGQLIPVEINSVKINFEGGTAYYATARDISHRKDAQRKILQAILKTEETERKRFAKELHDGLGALISAIKMYVDLLLEEKISEERVPEILRSTKELIDEAAFSAREIANNIKPHMLSNFGLTASLTDFLKRVDKAGNISAKLFHNNFSGKLEDEIELTVYRIITELVNNTLKYAEADDLRIALRHKNNVLTVIYADNGKGFVLSEILKSENRGNGIKNLIARSENLNAGLKLAAVPGKGVFVKLKSDLKL